MDHNFKIIWSTPDGWKIHVKVFNADGVRELEQLGYYFDDFVGDGTEVWKR